MEGHTPRISVSGGLAWGPRLCLCNKIHEKELTVVLENHYSRVITRSISWRNRQGLSDSKTFCVPRVTFHSWLRMIALRLEWYKIKSYHCHLLAGWPWTCNFSKPLVPLQERYSKNAYPAELLKVNEVTLMRLLERCLTLSMWLL